MNADLVVKLRVPCIVGTRTATQVLRDGELITVDGSAGKVLAGRIGSPIRTEPRIAAAAPTTETLGTKVYVNLAMPEHAQDVAALPVDGVGLLRAHPRQGHRCRSPEMINGVFFRLVRDVRSETCPPVTEVAGRLQSASSLVTGPHLGKILDALRVGCD